MKRNITTLHDFFQRHVVHFLTNVISYSGTSPADFVISVLDSQQFDQCLTHVVSYPVSRHYKTAQLIRRSISDNDSTFFSCVITLSLNAVKLVNCRIYGNRPHVNFCNLRNESLIANIYVKLFHAKELFRRKHETIVIYKCIGLQCVKSGLQGNYGGFRGFTKLTKRQKHAVINETTSTESNHNQ